MGKKRKRAKYISKGQGSSHDHSITKAIRRDRSPLDKLAFKSAAWLKGHNPWLTIDNPNCDGRVNTNKRWVRIRANDYWGDPRKKWSDKDRKKEKEQQDAD